METWLPKHGLGTLLSALVLLASLARAGPRYSSRIVSTISGQIRGVILEADSERLEPVEAFLGVKYGEAERWEEAGAATPWSGTRLADSFAPVCPQALPDLTNRTRALQSMPLHRYNFIKKWSTHLVNQSEDCLTINIYVPGSGARGLEAPYAVIVFIHGESFMWSSGNPYDGRVLASLGHVIFISVNYRLGILGFLKTKSGKETPVGVLDVAAALRWTKQNIGAFGGDPRRITLVGQGTGASIANLLLIHSQAKGMFSGVVLLSGSVLSPWGVVLEPTVAREEVSRRLGCPPGLQAVPCLRALPLQVLLALPLAPPRFLPALGPWTAPYEPQAAVVAATQPFLSTSLLLTTTSTESFLDFTEQDIEYGLEEEQRNRILRTFVRNAFVYHLNEIFSTIRNEYTDWEKPIQHPINIRDSTMEALSDGHTVAPLLRLAFLHSRRGSPTYFCHFAYQSKESLYPQRLGSVRGEDVWYFLGLPLTGSTVLGHNYTAQDARVAELALTFLTNFAKTANPNLPRRVEGLGTAPSQTSPKGGRLKPFTWDPYEPSAQLYLSLSAKTRMKSHYRGHKMSIWLNLIPQLHQPGDSDVTMRHHHFHERASHYYSGAVRAETYTRVPLVGSTEPALCSPNITGDGPLELGPGPGPPDGTPGDLTEDLPEEDDEEALLLKKHYYSTSTALGVTVGLGCLLLLLNALALGAIYYQRSKRARPGGSPKESSPKASTSLESPTIQLDSPLQPAKKVPPAPPTRTSSNPPTGTIKKRVQIQEISV